MTSGRGRRVANGAAALVLFALALAVNFARPGPADAQTNPSPSHIQLSSQTTWVGDGGTFQLAVAVTTPDPADAQMQLSLWNPLTDRSQFTATLTNHLDTSRMETFDPVSLSTLGPSPMFTIDVNRRAGAGAESVFLSTSGVYPVTVDLFDANDNLLDRLISYLVYNGPDTVGNGKLDVAWVAPFTAPPPASTKTTGSAISPAEQAGLSNLSGALAAHPNVPVTLDATPQTVDALASGTPSERAVVTQLAQGLSAGEVVNAPYVRLDLPAMLGAGLDSEIGQQLAAGTEALTTGLHVAPSAGTWIATGPLTPSVVDDLAARGMRQIVVADEALSPLPASDLIRTPAQPFTVMGKTSHLTALSVDPGLAAQFATVSDEQLAAHQLLAELAVIQLELPNRKGGRGVVIVPPTGWQPDAAFLSTFLDGLGTAPMLAPVTVDQLFSTVTPLEQGNSPLVRSVVPLDQQPKGQSIDDGPAIRAARAPIASLAAVVPAGTPAIAQIGRRVLLSESADLTDQARAAELAAAVASINHLKAMVHLPGNQSITFTARQGRIPITVLSSAPYPLKVRLRITSEKLGFRPVGLPGGQCTETGTSEQCNVVLSAQNTTVRVPVVAKTTGVFSLTVALDSPDGALNLATDQDTVRSTAASGVGVVLSIGAALLLALWWLRDVRHSRRARRLVPEVGGPVTRAGLIGLGGGGLGRATPGADAGAGAGGLVRAPLGFVAPEPPDPELVAYGLDVSALVNARRSPMQPVQSWDRCDDPSGLVTQPTAIVFAQPSTTIARPPAPVSASASAADEPADAAVQGDAFSRNTAVMAGGTLLSRLTGFGRVLALIWAFGITSGLTDVYNIANTAPNILYDLVLGGVLSATLVPVFVDYLNQDDPEESRRAISAVVTAIAVTLLALSVVFWLLAPLIIRFYLVLAPSAGVGNKQAIGTALLHMFVPQLFLLGGIAVTTALLNARRRFAAAAFSPVTNNLVAIGAIVVARMVATSLTLPGFQHDQSALLILGLGTTAGYFIQFLVQLPATWRAGFRLRPRWDLHHPAVRTVLRLSLWTFGSVITNQISLTLVLVLADHRTGDVTVFNTAYQFFQLPYAIFAVSIASVITTDLAEHWSKRDLPRFRSQMAAGMRLTMAVLVPAAVGYVALAQPFLHLVLRHGAFTLANAHLTASVVVLFAAGLPGFSAYLLLMRGYQAMQDTRSMFWLYLFENLLTVALASALYPILGVRGLALGWVGAYSIGAIAAFVHLRRRTGGLEGRTVATGLVRIAGATALMILPVFALLHLLKGDSDLVLLAQVGGGVIAGAIVYLAAAQAFGVTELTSMLRRKGLR